MTTVASPAPVDEPVSPELALVDAELAQRLRALLPEIELQIPLVPDEPPPRLLRVLPDPEPDNLLALRPPPELLDGVEIVAAPVGPVVPPPLFPSRIDRWRSLAKAFAAGAAVATFVTVGVVAKLGEGPPEPSADPGTIPPRTASAAPGAAAGGASTGSPAKRTPSTPRSGSAGAPATQQGGSAEKSQPAKKSQPAQKATAPKKASAPGAAAKPKQPATSAQPAKQAPAAKETQGAKVAASAAAEPRRFAWAPVDGAVGYRVELFRGAKQLLQANTKSPAYELAAIWHHEGRLQKLTSGTYRWYVWPVFSSGPAAKAVVQAELTVP